MSRTGEELKNKIIAELQRDPENADCTPEELEEMAEWEIKAGNIKNYTQATVEKKPKVKREIKLDDEKVSLIENIAHALEELNPTIVNPQKEITFVYNGGNYSLSLIKHRPPKK